MTKEQTEDLKEILICLVDETQELKSLCESLNRKLEDNKVNVLKIQNQISLASCLIPETEKEINRLKAFIEQNKDN